ncbi:hypothetical protein H0H93_015550 [Arthromyces matolae]|nr:hypothetical protein H0H93_015550 [Arthromyces matolae]
MRMVQGNNQSFGSPVNRIKITGFWASKSLTQAPNLSLTQRLREWWHYFIFRSVMFHLDLMFWKNKVFLWIRRHLGLRPGVGFEDEMERTMRGFAKSNLGVDPGPSAFEG